MKRRTLMQLLVAQAGLLVVGTKGFSAKMAAKETMKGGKIRLYSAEKGDYVELDRVVKTEEEWRKLLSADRFHVLREEGTERAFTGELLKNKDYGVYRCAACGNDLYHSDHKFDSGTGWPSYYKAIAEENVATRIDKSFFMVRNELICSRCESHLGHVFDDGPPPTGKRHCINSLSLTFHKLKQPDGMS